ncbi:hypothetical protein HYALB_00004685 [Hymenoscyphus albidus]|uniref:Carrier domain-containing protein n=1 Tax=Hymenoscyphus albidus TaxID=595503 RepID=A0A9N9LSH7_9HELO|nr:hypothetical protein HYALB_00004685 [Hymenoscyphus albidus]
MLAAGLSFESATEICARPEYIGRASVAAANAPTSVTLSGDLDAIDEIKAELDSEKTFNRKLNVDTAYHSHHMKACSTAYLASLKACNIQVQRPKDSCVWVSSVHGNADVVLADEDDEDKLNVLKAQYWVDNLLSPVLFAPAVEHSLGKAGPFDAAAEVGPHHALKGPVTQILKASLGNVLPYFGTMRRDEDEVEALSGALGYLWENLGPAALIDFEGYRRAFSDPQDKFQAPRLVKGLPSYSWDHSRIHWKESRISHNYRLSDRHIQEILGRRATDDTPELLRWRNILRPTEIPWVRDHAFQGQILLPGASYIAAIIEAVKVLAKGSSIKYIKLLDVKIPKAVVLHENKSTELITSLQLNHKTGSLLSADFAFSATSADDAKAVPERTCSGSVEVYLDEGSSNQRVRLPLPSKAPPNTNAVDHELFYENLRDLGINYQGLFRAAKSVKRVLNYASTITSWDDGNLGNLYSLHPAVLDVGLQAVLAAFASPSSGQMWTMYLPVGIRQMTIHMDSLPRYSAAGIETENVARVTASSTKGIEGEVQIMFDSRLAVQIEDLEMQVAGDASTSSKQLLFSNTRWDSDISTGIDKLMMEKPDRVSHNELYEALGRTALYYYRTLLDEISPREVKGFAWHQQLFWQSAQHWVEEVGAGRHPNVKREWLEDSREAVWKQVEKYQNSIDIVMMRALGEKLPSIARGQTQAIEVMMENDMLGQFYAAAYGFESMNDQIARALSQISHRYPHANILEIGGGVGGTTGSVLRAMGDAFSHYTFTDISSGFFEKAAEKFAEYRHKMTFRVCDIEKDPIDEGFVEEGYDVIIAANVLHATRNMADTMRHVRRLLKPGGYLVMMEMTGDMLRMGFIMGALTGWWFGAQMGDEGRQWSPALSVVQWDDLLQRTGFSGVDQAVADHTVSQKHQVTTLVSQAVDEQFNVLRSPLSNLDLLPTLSHRLVILGGETLPIARLAKDLKRKLASWISSIDTISHLESLSLDPLERVSVISLTELDQSLFAIEMTADKLDKIQTLLSASESILWTRTGSRGSDPNSNMFTGIARALRTEQPDINLQLLDLEKPSDANSEVLAEYFIRLVLAKQQDYSEKSMLWTTEPELALDGEILKISRLIPDRSRNERYNATRRMITKNVTLASSEIEIDIQDGVVSLLGVESALSRRLMAPRTPDQLVLDVDLSMALPCTDQQYFLCYGSVRQKGGKAYTVSRKNGSVILSSFDETLQLESPPGNAPMLMEALAAQIIARSLASNLSRRGAILVYEPPSESFVQAIEYSSSWKGRHVYYATSRTDPAVPTSWIYINPHALTSSIKQMLPSDIATVVDFSAPNARDIRTFVPTNCLIKRLSSSVLEAERQDLASAYTDALLEFKDTKKSNTTVLPIQTLAASASSTTAYPALIDWRPQNDESIMVQVKPLMPLGMFSSTKTHFMVGLNGDLGQSICAYMIRNGARYLAIGSRRGEVNPDWLESMQRDHRADIRLYKMDVCSRQSVRSTIDQIESEMPPIGGVANGALILHDKMFLNMDVESLNDTLKPKVDGTRYLDELFSAPKLDYFVLFSSVATVGNNRGQGNYHAANLFMESLVSNRRSRGLAASAIHMGVVVDAGYVASHPEKLRALEGFMWTSEADAHFLFAEGVLASPADSQLAADICMGFKPFFRQGGEAASPKPSWYGDSRLSHFIVQMDEGGGSRNPTQEAGAKVNLRRPLDEAKTAQEAHSLLQEVLSVKLETMMQLDVGSVNAHVPLLAMGFDSLIAVETRSWLLKEINIDIPVLRFLSGDTIHEICEAASAQYFASRVEQIQESEKVQISATDHDQMPEMKQTEQLSISTSSLETSPTPTTMSSNSPAGSSWVEVEPDVEVEKVATAEIVKKIEKPKRTEFVREEAMSYAQSRLWFLDQYLDDPTTCNIAVSYMIKGSLDPARLRESLDKVIAHHPALRTCFFANNETGEPTQGLLRSPSLSSSLKYHHASSYEEVQREFVKLQNHEWDLANGHVFEATLISTENKDQHFIVFGYPHIVIDGVSWAVFLRDLQRAYTSQPLSRQKKLYLEASLEQRKAVASGALDNEIAYWRKIHAELPDVLPLLPFASTRRRRPMRRYEGHTVTTDLGSQLVSKIKAASMALRVTPVHFYLAAVQVLFSKLIPAQNLDLCIGITDASRTDEDIADTVGFLMNILPLRCKYGRNDSFAELAQRTSKQVLEARSNSQVPVDVILDRLNVPRDVSFNPLYQITFNYRNSAISDVDLGKDCTLSMDAFRDAEMPFDLAFGAYETAEGTCRFQVVGQTYLYDRDATELVSRAYIRLLDMLSSDTSRILEQYDMTDSVAVQKGISVGKGPRKIPDGPNTLSKRVDTHSKRNGSSVAIIEPHKTTTYNQLEDRIHSLVSLIQKRLKSNGCRIAVLCQPSSNIIVSMLAILRLGHIYVPLDASLPRERHAAILADCQPTILLCHEETLELALTQMNDNSVVNLSDLSMLESATDANSQIDLSDPTSPAFLFYTSGSTGKPKGIMLNNFGMLNHIATTTSAVGLQRETVLQQSSFGFDMSLTQTFCALANGGSLVIAPKASRGDPVALSKLMLEHNVTLTFATPSEYTMLLRYGQSWLQKCTNWKHAFMGGEAVTQQVLQSFSELGNPNIRLTNGYGPTETSCVVSFENLSTDSQQKITEYTSVGKALPNYSVYILDETSSQPVPLGYPGEICVGGAGVALGYLNLSSLSASKFLEDPFATADDVSRDWTRMFKTGDRGRLLSDGSLIVMGRRDGDTMIKLRGLRIDLDDVANTMVQAASEVIAEAIVTAHGEDEAKRLVAHVVLRPGESEKLGARELRKLAQNLPLPTYMCPSLVVALDSLPRTTNGKVDRKAIQAMDLPLSEEQGDGSTEKLSLQEGEVSLLWEEVLGQSMAGSRVDLTPESDFFMVGGSSLLLMQLQGAIRETLMLTVSIAELYQASTLGRMAAHLFAKKDNQGPIEELDWEKETEFQVPSMSLSTPTTSSVRDSGYEILLTGAHSFLGAEILQILVHDSSVKRVHCVALPKKALKTAPLSNKVACYPGTLQSESLGLSPEDISFLQPRINLIIHGGSIGHCMNNYPSLRAPNIGSLRFLVDFAYPRRIPIHFISSSRVTLLSGKDQLPPVSVSAFEPPKDGSSGFTASKWAGERILERVAQTTGINVTAHRPCALIGTNAPPEDALNSILRFSLERNIVPRFSHWDGFLDFASVTAVAANIARLALKKDTSLSDSDASKESIVNLGSAGDSTLVIAHHSSGTKSPVAKFQTQMETLFNQEFAEQDMTEWIAEAVKIGMDPLISTFLMAMVDKNEIISFPYLGEPLK